MALAQPIEEVTSPDVVIGATDGSARRVPGKSISWVLGFGWVSLDGRFHCGGTQLYSWDIGSQASLVAELQAIWCFLRYRPAGKHAMVLSDSQQALQFLKQWSKGVMTMPSGYARGLDLIKLAYLVRDRRRDISWQHVEGHQGHLLNECADSLAKIGRLSIGTAKKVTMARSRSLVEGFMADPRTHDITESVSR